MLYHPVWRLTAVLFVIGGYCLLGGCPASGQDIDSSTQFDSPWQASPYLAEQPKAEPKEAQAKPPVTPPSKEKQPPVGPPTVPPPERPTPPAREPAPRLDLSSMLAMRGPIFRLASVPNMFGDFGGWSELVMRDVSGEGVVNIPPPGGVRRLKISENDKALPMDRVLFTYNHFHNALDAAVDGPGQQSFPIDQYTVGLEKTFRDGLWSVELRMPFSTTPQVLGENLMVGNGEVGNLVVTVKRLLYLSRTTAVGIGLPIDTPTGEDITGEGQSGTFALSNDAVHLAPFIGFLTAPNDRVFWQGFLQVDVAANGNRVVFDDTDLGKLNEQTLLFVDLSWGFWLYRNPRGSLITGLAPVVEYHYTTTLQDGEVLGDHQQLFQIGNTLNRMDVSNVTVGLHTELGKTTVRVGGVFPISENPDRLYDAEVQVSVNRRF